MNNEILSPLYAVPNGYECETVYGLFTTSCKWKVKAQVELQRWLADNRQPEPEAA